MQCTRARILNRCIYSAKMVSLEVLVLSNSLGIGCRCRRLTSQLSGFCLIQASEGALVKVRRLRFLPKTGAWRVGII